MDKILVVDDEVEILRTVTTYLQDEYVILTAENAQDAMTTFKKEKPAVIITDVRKPGMSGIELMRRIKSMDGDAEFIVITGHGDKTTATEAIRLGAVDFLLKPVDIERLENSINTALERSRKKRDILEYVEGLMKK